MQQPWGVIMTHHALAILVDQIKFMQALQMPLSSQGTVQHHKRSRTALKPEVSSLQHFVAFNVKSGHLTVLLATDA